MIDLLFFVLSPIVIVIGAIAFIYVGGALVTSAPLIVLMPILGLVDWIVEALQNGMTTLRAVVDDFVTGLW